VDTLLYVLGSFIVSATSHGGKNHYRHLHGKKIGNDPTSGKKGNNDSPSPTPSPTQEKDKPTVEKDFNDGATLLNTTSCPILITDPGRYLLTNNLDCDPGFDGISIASKDVYLECQDYNITGGATDNSFPAGIRILNGSEDVTISKCHATNFTNGFVASDFGGIVASSLNENDEFGAFIFDRISGASGIVAIVNSHFDNNRRQGIDIQTDAVFISSTVNGSLGYGLVAVSSDMSSF
jgi:hypothetical protein